MAVLVAGDRFAIDMSNLGFAPIIANIYQFGVTNLFNHTNYGSYTTQEVSTAYGKPSSNPAVAYQPRMAQLGFRVTF